MFGLVSVATFTLLTVLGIGIHGTYSEKEAVEHLYNNHIESYSRLHSIDKIWIENQFLLQSLLSPNDSEQRATTTQQFKQNSTKLEQISTTLIEKFDTEHASTVEQYRLIANQSTQLATTILPEITNTVLSGDAALQDSELFRTRVSLAMSEIANYRDNLQALITENRRQSANILQKSDQVFWLEVAMPSILTFLFIITYVVFAFMFSQDISHRLHDIRRYFKRLVKQDYLFEVDVKNNDEIGDVLQSLKVMKVQLAYNMETVRQKAISATRVKIALDNVSTNMMIEDSDHTIIYVNPAIVSMFEQAESEFQTLSPDFDPSQLVGTKIKDLNIPGLCPPPHQPNLPGEFEHEQIAANKEQVQEVDIDGRIFRIVSNPVIDATGQQIGYVTEWSDRTAEIAVEKEIEHVIASAVDGDFTKRMDLNGKNPFFTMLCGNMNRLLEISEVSLADIVSVLSALAKGDLTAQIEADYSGAFGELKTSSNLTVSKLKEMIQHIKVSADTINTATKEIAIGNIDLAQRTEKQARSLEVTSSSMEELTITVKQNSEHSKQANLLAKQTSDNARKGGEVVKQVVENMSEIHTSSREIMNIISVIDSIAFQTNILALNAAVEAARAGEQGRGFAVVATEVRNLAQRSAAAAKEVESLINSSVNKIETGSKLASQAGDSISGVVNSIQDVAQLIEEITQASVEQSTGIDQVTQAILEVDDVTQQNSALVEEGSAAASSLEEQVANLALYVSVFDTGDQHTSDDTGGSKLPPRENHLRAVSPRLLSNSDNEDWAEF
ncbi:methyl-accepting chemotaxis protein [Vibrio variabilis]|uniref:methyl-accepting chemotaxis protein n=1 Tax=Vibrio variabilis TaxID=990271 RepID=UPI000DD791FF|nr:methyl-accepting chemotaxis protein [Vibrio variabilis]